MTSTPEFVRRATAKFGARFDYSGVLYVSAKSPVSIECRIHGLYRQSPQDHLRSTYGCPSCGETAKRKPRSSPRKTKKSTTPEEYLQRLTVPPGYSVDMSRYGGITHGQVGIVCPSHGTSWENPRSALIRSYLCAKCGKSNAHPKVKEFDDFLAMARKVHGEAYSYREEDYENRKSVLQVTCIRHGVFFKSAQKHIAGQGCSVCVLTAKILDGKYPGGYSERYFQEHPEVINLPATLYYARVGRRYKIGITAGPINRRLSSIRSTSKQTTELIKTWSLPLREAYREEQRILTVHGSRRISRRWSTEVFDVDVLRLDTEP